jgi:hypothetical protein
LFLLSWESDKALIQAARAVTGFTHGDPAVMDAAEYFARVVLAIQRGADIPAALQVVASPQMKGISAARASSISTQSDSAALMAHGLSCDIAKGFPALCHLLFRYPEDPAAALIANARAGGDSAARGTLLGMIYGAKFPTSALPAEWVNELKVAAEVLVPEVISRTYHCPAADKLVLVTDCPATSPLSAVVLVAVITGFAVPVLIAEVVIALVAPLANRTVALSAKVDATRFLLMMKVELSRIAVMVEPNGMPVPAIGWPTTNPEVVPAARVRVAVAVEPVAARASVAVAP